MESVERRVIGWVLAVAAVVLSWNVITAYRP
jgi:TRAP-type C4-dicarboxylate transport system permease small subunit